MNKNESLQEFQRILKGQKDVCLIVAKNESEMDDFAKFFEGSGFQTSKNVFDFFSFEKSYLVLDENLPKDFYDFLTQYPTGQVEIFDREKNESKVFSPDYQNQVFVLVATEERLAKLKEKGFEIMDKVGPVYRS